MLRAPSEGRPRTTLRRLLRYAVRRSRADSAALAELLTQAGADWDADYDEKEPGRIKSVLLLPFIVAGGAFMMTTMIFGFMVVNPFLRRAWRARRYLADATAVQLTRNPDALGRALSTLAAAGDVVPGTEWAAHLFVVGRSKPAQKETSPMPEFQPPVRTRIERLNAMGAHVAVQGPVRTPRQRLVLVGLALVTSPCWVPLAATMLGCALVMTGVSLAIDSLFLTPVVALLHALLRGLAGG
jgi:hypothetical protein